MSTVVNILDALMAAEEENRNTYDIYGQLTEQYSARNLLAMLEAASADRLEQLRRFAIDGDGSGSLPAPSPAEEADEGEAYGFDAGMQYTDFLLLICRREAALAERYRRVRDAAVTDRARTLFGRLADDCERRRRLAQSRYDLETLI